MEPQPSKLLPSKTSESPARRPANPKNSSRKSVTARCLSVRSLWLSAVICDFITVEGLLADLACCFPEGRFGHINPYTSVPRGNFKRPIRFAPLKTHIPRS